MTADLHSLTGAYVLDAVPDDERRAFEFHLNGCESCGREVREFRATATRLGSAVAMPPPPAVKARVLARIRAVRQGGRVRVGRSDRLVRVFAAAAAVLLVVATSLGVALARYPHLEEGRPVSALSAVMGADDVRLVRADSSAGRVTLVVSRRQDRLVLLTEGVPQPPPGRAYQIWKVTLDYRSAGLLPGGNAAVEIPGIADTERIAITVEPVGGSSRPTDRPVITASLT
ncbi:MAG: anti-sigma factor [Actinophytocola sp.]|uniref:anti-sigma factor n=1 Tax=Actinophytocola sp. TaxID=1872138 RepID=UPI003D6B7829